jgi:outer membrane protein assembly factor BamB
MSFQTLGKLASAACALVALAVLAFWLWPRDSLGLKPRVPGTDEAPDAETGSASNPVQRGQLTLGNGQPANLPGEWPQFRGPKRDGISRESLTLNRHWSASPPRLVWTVDVGEGYAGPVISQGRVYLMDYDRDKQQDALRCLSLADGREIWRYAYPIAIKRNHGMSRTVPALASNLVVAIGPKCHVLCADATSGELHWTLDLVQQFGATIPPWYAGQCPLIEGDKVILAPGGKSDLLVALSLQTGEVLWRTPNPRGWKMTHSSIMPLQFGSRRLYIYCGSGGVAAVSADDGALLWDSTEWRISIANVPSPVALDDGRVFLTGGYNAGSLMLQFAEQDGKVTAKSVFRIAAEEFGATQHTPILHNGHLFGTRADGEFVCLGLDGKVVWSSGPNTNFGLGPWLLAGDVIFVMNDTGKLTLVEASTSGYRELGTAEVLKGHDAWGPMALAGGRLLARDLTRLVCLEVGTQ